MGVILTQRGSTPNVVEEDALAVLAAAELGEIVDALRQVLRKVDALLDETLPAPAEAQAKAAREQLASIIEDALDLIEVDDAFREAGDQRIPWDQFRTNIPRA